MAPGRIRLVSDRMPELCPMRGRSSGIHVSEVIHDIATKTLGLYEDTGEIDGAARFRMEMGNCLEHALIQRLQLDDPDRYVQPGELERDGIFGTPDLLDVRDWVVGEVKLTDKRVADDPDDSSLWSYWVQVGAYCYMLDSTVCRLKIGYLYGKAWREWEREWTPLSLAENWAMIKTRAEVMRRQHDRD